MHRPVHSLQLQRIADKLVSLGLEKILELNCDFKTQSVIGGGLNIISTANSVTLGSFDDGFSVGIASKDKRVYFVLDKKNNVNYFFFGSETGIDDRKLRTLLNHLPEE